MITASALSFGVVALAEIGDKSQLVCMTLASRHRARPVLIGAIAAFLLLNVLAVTVGASLATWLPTTLITAFAALLFALFGLQALRAGSESDEGEGDDEETAARAARSGRSILLTTFLLIFVAELGDKTQLAVAAMSTSESPIGVWIGASLALAATSAVGVFAGRRFLSRINPLWLHRASGAFFLLLAALTGVSLVS